MLFHNTLEGITGGYAHTCVHKLTYKLLMCGCWLLADRPPKLPAINDSLRHILPTHAAIANASSHAHGGGRWMSNRPHVPWEFSAVILSTWWKCYAHRSLRMHGRTASISNQIAQGPQQTHTHTHKNSRQTQTAADPKRPCMMVLTPTRRSPDTDCCAIWRPHGQSQPPAA